MITIQEKFFINCHIKNRDHFIFATVPFTSPSVAIKKKEELLKSASEKMGKPIPKPYRIPRAIRNVSENLEFHMNNSVDSFFDCSRASKAGRTKEKLEDNEPTAGGTQVPKLDDEDESDEED